MFFCFFLIKIWTGDNGENACGNSITCTSTSPCAYGDGSINAVDIEAGDEYSTVVADNGEVYASGKNFNGFLGIGSSATPIATPLKVVGAIVGKNIVRVKSSGSHTLAIDSTGQLFSWGENLRVKKKKKINL